MSGLEDVARELRLTAGERYRKASKKINAALERVRRWGVVRS